VKAGGFIPPRQRFLRVRDGERHPGLLEGGALRGATLERRPRSVRLASSGSSAASRRADDSGCPKVAEEGNSVSMRHRGHAPDRKHERSRSPQGWVLRSVLRPVHVNPHSLCGESFGGGALESVSRLGKLVKARRTNTGAGLNGRSAARRVSPLPQGRGRDASRKGRRSRPPSLRGLKSSGLVARTSKCSCRSR